jgi:uncharacterized protein
MDYPLVPTIFTQVQLDDDLWRPRLETNRAVTIPYAFARCEETGRIANFARAAGRADGPHEGRFYNDSDVFKVVEGASYALHARHDPVAEAYLDRVIELIEGAQEADGYLYTARTIDPSAVRPDQEGSERWSNLRVSHELYNVGHLYDAAVAHHHATGKRTLLDVALRSADLVSEVFGPSRRRDVPGHQQIEMGLVKLYRVTGVDRYLELAKFFLDERGRPHGRTLYHNFDDPGYMQDHLPVTAQSTAVGHAVRAMYMYCGMADVAAHTGDEAYVRALDALWDDVVRRKTYLTGGVGARHHGEAFGEPYELPNHTAYAETCAAIGSVMWNHRMFLLHGDAKYLDVLERTLYNGLIAGVALDGTTFFYANPLASDGAWNFNHGEGCTRSPWFECSCCPTNVVRFLASLPGYLYATTGNEMYVNLYVAGAGSVDVAGLRIGVEQRTRYPWSGAITLTLTPERAARFTLALRIPAWVSAAPLPGDLYAYLGPRRAPDATLAVNGRPVTLDVRQGFARIDRTWQPGDVVELDLPMSPRRVVSHDAVAENRGLVAIERGPIVYCAEAIDNGGTAAGLSLADDTRLDAQHDPSRLGGVTTIRADHMTLIPYYAWGHRGAGEMQVWLRRGASAA